MASGEPRKAIYDIAVAELERELSSASALGTRASSLIGFSGVILALAATIGRDTLTRDLGSIGRPLATYSLIAAIVVLVFGAVVASIVVAPRQRGRVKPGVLRELRHADDAEGDIYERLSKSAITQASEEGAKNDGRGTLLLVATVSVVIGLLLIGVQAVVVATTLMENPCSIQTTATTAKTTQRLTPTTTPVAKTSSTDCARATSVTPSSAER